MMVAVKSSLDALALFLSALETADVDNLPGMPGVFVQFGLTLQDFGAEQRRNLLTNWIFGKGLHDLARSVRQSLEEAYTYVRMFNSPSGVMTFRTIQQRVWKIAKGANELSFPDLMSQVNSGLTTPLSFATEFLSLQKARNCLEHRAGNVGLKDVDENGEMVLKLPFMEVALKRSNGEIAPVVDGYIAEGEEVLVLRQATLEKRYRQGDKFAIDAVEFTKIAQACMHFAFDLQTKLPVGSEGTK